MYVGLNYSLRFMSMLKSTKSKAKFADCPGAHNKHSMSRFHTLLSNNGNYIPYYSATVPRMKNFLTPPLLSVGNLQPSERSAFSSLNKPTAIMANRSPLLQEIH